MDHASDMVLVRYALVFVLGAGVAVTLDRTAGAAPMTRLEESANMQLSDPTASDRTASVTPPPSARR